MNNEKANYGWYHKKMTVYYLLIGSIGVLSLILGFFTFNPLNFILMISGVLIIILFLWPGLGITFVNLIRDASKSHPCTNLKAIITLENPKILDIGCGTGKVAINMAKNLQNGGHVYGIDIFGDAISNNALSTVESNADIEGVNNITTFKYGSATNIPFNDNFFNVVNMAYVFHEISDKTKALDEISRVLKPGGIFYLCEFYRRNIMTFLINGIYFIMFKKKEYWMGLLRKKGFKKIIYINQGTARIIAASKMIGE